MHLTKTTSPFKCITVSLDYQLLSCIMKKKYSENQLELFHRISLEYCLPYKGLNFGLC